MSPQTKVHRKGIIYDKVNYKPLFFRLHNEADKKKWQALRNNNPTIKVCDEFLVQLNELHKLAYPSKVLSQDDYDRLNKDYFDGKTIEDLGVWVFYPWSNLMIHILEEADFIKVRTNRNHYKITPEEEKILSTKIVGVVGLSVGQSVALALAMERSFGELRLADFDEIELSNLNRIRTPLHNMGVKKAVVVAREISEIDPYLKVKLFLDGLTDENMDAFFTEGGKMDLLMEECDSLDMKIKGRLKAKALQIPVVMDTSDRGMIDVERFDLEPDRPIFHGLVAGMDVNNLSELSNEEKIPYILKMIGGDDISPRLKASIYEVKQSISTWPQLATSVIMGGAIAADVGRRILLNSFHDSGRYCVDINKIFSNRSEALVKVSPEQMEGDNLLISCVEAWNETFKYQWEISLYKETILIKKVVDKTHTLFTGEKIRLEFSKGVLLQRIKEDLYRASYGVQTIDDQFGKIIIEKLAVTDKNSEIKSQEKTFVSVDRSFEVLKADYAIGISHLDTSEKVEQLESIIGELERLILLSNTFNKPFVRSLKNSSSANDQRWTELFADSALMTTFANCNSGVILKERVRSLLKNCNKAFLVSVRSTSSLDMISFGKSIEKLNGLVKTQGFELKGIHVLPTLLSKKLENDNSALDELSNKINKLFDLSATDHKYFLFTVMPTCNSTNPTRVHDMLL